MRDNNLPFKPKARIMELLGEQLIKSHILALFELVKNSYDADATVVDITMLDISNSETAAIEVRDNGCGMSFDTVSNIWMEPGHGHKKDKRKLLLNLPRSDRGRLPIGEKGVGRFAAHRLGSVITLVTKAKDQNEVVVKIDWNDFLSHDYLEDATVRVYEQTPKVFLGNDTGTQITIDCLKNSWKRGDVRQLYRQVVSMTNSSILEEDSVDFVVNFEMEPKQSWLDGLVSFQDVKDQGLFYFKFTLTDEGLKHHYKFTPYEALVADYRGLVCEREVTTDGYKSSEFFVYEHPIDGAAWNKRKKRTQRPVLSGDGGLGIGPISGVIIGYDFDKEIKNRYLRDEAAQIDRYLKQQGGIKVYRDGLRVYNYGEASNDWLNLDHRRIQNPGNKISNKLMLGEIHLDLSVSDGLNENTNREGFIENEAYDELKYAMTCILSEFEIERSKDKKILRDVLKLPKNTGELELPVKKTVEGLLDNLSEIVKKKYPSDKQLESITQDVQSTYLKARDALLSSTGAGLGLVTVFHELERGVRALHLSIEKGNSSHDLSTQSNELVRMFQGVVFLVNKNTMENTDASRLVDIVIDTQIRRFKRHGVTFLNGFEARKDLDFKIKGLRRMLIASLVNLIDNAIYWMDREEGKENILWIGPSNELEGPSIIIADNGSGFMDEQDDLIEPFFSRRPEGMGIGLYYTDWVMRSHKGRLAFPLRKEIDVPSKLDGALVALVFESRQKG